MFRSGPKRVDRTPFELGRATKLTGGFFISLFWDMWWLRMCIGDEEGEGAAGGCGGGRSGEDTGSTV